MKFITCLATNNNQWVSEMVIDRNTTRSINISCFKNGDYKMKFTKKIIKYGSSYILTIPPDIRSALSIESGDMLEVDITNVIKKKT